MIELKGKGGISAKIIKHSIGNEKEIITYELVYPRFFHSEVMTHRMLSKNAASSRAIPVKTMLELIASNPAKPIQWGKNQPGMQAAENFTGNEADYIDSLWARGVNEVVQVAQKMADYGVHKQITNRITEFCSFIKVVMTGTEYNNFFHLRYHPDAQPEFYELSRCMKEAKDLSAPQLLKPGQWHLPYVDIKFTNDIATYWVGDEEVDLETAKMVSASCCAQVSYRKLDDSIEKAKMIYQRLIESEPAHASPVEHQATPMSYGTLVNPLNIWNWEPGTTHVRSDMSLWSGNFCRWIQFRQLIPNQAKVG